jgi:ubiquinone/menaquinone biosynthesis C-methylase UbiE
MLNPTFSSKYVSRVKSNYVAPSDIAEKSIHGNTNFETGKELRLQDVYIDEIWIKLNNAGFTKEILEKSSILEICAGNGFLTYSILKKSNPVKLTVNDISEIEITENKKLINSNFNTERHINYIIGDIHNLNIDDEFDIVIGNSFLHHFHDVPRALESINRLLKKGGFFISLHEPTPLSTVVESAKIIALPIGILFPKLINDIARKRYKYEPSETDLWMFEKNKLKNIFNNTGFSYSKYHYWGLFRPIIVQKFLLHLSKDKPKLSPKEIRLLKFSIFLDSIINKILPARFFGSMCIVAKK